MGFERRKHTNWIGSLQDLNKFPKLWPFKLPWHQLRSDFGYTTGDFRSFETSLVTSFNVRSQIYHLPPKTLTQIPKPSILHWWLIHHHSRTKKNSNSDEQISLSCYFTEKEKSNEWIHFGYCRFFSVFCFISPVFFHATHNSLYWHYCQFKNIKWYFARDKKVYFVRFCWFSFLRSSSILNVPFYFFCLVYFVTFFCNSFYAHLYSTLVCVFFYDEGKKDRNNNSGLMSNGFHFATLTEKDFPSWYFFI